LVVQFAPTEPLAIGGSLEDWLARMLVMSPDPRERLRLARIYIEPSLYNMVEKFTEWAELEQYLRDRMPTLDPRQRALEWLNNADWSKMTSVQAASFAWHHGEQAGWSEHERINFICRQVPALVGIAASTELHNIDDIVERLQRVELVRGVVRDPVGMSPVAAPQQAFGVAHTQARAPTWTPMPTSFAPDDLSRRVAALEMRAGTAYAPPAQLEYANEPMYIDAVTGRLTRLRPPIDCRACCLPYCFVERDGGCRGPA
jgi:hypothetical protein